MESLAHLQWCARCLTKTLGWGCEKQAAFKNSQNQSDEHFGAYFL